MPDRTIRVYRDQDDKRVYLRRVSLFEAEQLVAHELAVAARTLNDRLQYIVLAADRTLMPKLAWRFRESTTVIEQFESGHRTRQHRRGAALGVSGVIDSVTTERTAGAKIIPFPAPKQHQGAPNQKLRKAA